MLLQPGSTAAAPSPPPKVIVNTSSMGFGRFVAASGGTIKLDVFGARTRTGGVVLLASNASPARFSILGIGNDHRVYVLTLPPDGSVVLRAGVNQMVLSQFVSNTPAGGLLPAGTHNISVGARLQVAPNQAPGNYSGTFRVTLEYQ